VERCVKNGKPNMQRERSTYRGKMCKLYEMANEYDELDKEWDEVEECREWIKTYNGGIKKIRKIMKRNWRIPEKGKEYWEKYEELRKKKVEQLKNYWDGDGEKKDC
jgi:hypothetical protein